MIRDALIILRKELRGIVKDKRTLFATLIVPLLLMPLIFVGMNIMETRQQETARETLYRIAIINNDDPAFLSLIQEQLQIELISVSMADDQTLTVLFPDGYIPGMQATVGLQYSSTSQKSLYAASVIDNALSAYSAYLAAMKLAPYGIELDALFSLQTRRIDIAPEQAQGGGMIVSIMVPYLILIYVFAGAMGVGMDTTSGEKERGSLAVILVNQISRTSLAIGKVMYVVVIGILSSLMTFIGFIAALSLSGGFFGESVSFSAFTPESLIYLLITLLFTSILAASVIVFIGSLARTIKEATSYIMPIYFIVIIVGVLTMRVDPTANPLLYAVPFLNTVFMLKGALVGAGSLSQLMLMAASNLLLISLFIYATSRLYNSERILNTVS